MKDFFQFNIGQVISVITFVIGAAMVWQKMKDKMESIGKDTDRNTRDIEELTRMGIMTTVNQHERRLSTVETAISEIAAMQRDIAWIKSAIDDGRLKHRNIGGSDD